MNFKTFFVLFILILIGVGIYFYPKITGETSAWNPHLDAVKVSSVGEAEYTKPTIVGTVLTDYTVSFKKRGDSVTYQFQLVNDSDYAAELTSIVKSVPRCEGKSTSDEELVCDHLVYSILNEDGTELTEGVVLAERSSRKVLLTITYEHDEDPSSAVLVDNLDVDFLLKKN